MEANITGLPFQTSVLKIYSVGKHDKQDAAALRVLKRETDECFYGCLGKVVEGARF